MRTSHALSIPVLLAALATSTAGAAQQPSPPAKPVVEAMTEKARQLFAEGVKAYQKSRWTEAHAAFLAAWALSKHYTITGNLADCELKLGMYRDAAEHFSSYVREMAKDAGSTPQERKDGDARFAQAKAKVGQVAVQVNVAGAEVYADGKPIGTAPLAEPIFLDPGPHAFEARHEGYASARATLTATAGTEQPATLTLTRSSVEPQPPLPLAPQRPIWPAITAGGVAVAVVGIGAALAGVAAGKESAGNTLRAMIPGQPPCPAGTTNPQCQTLTNDGTVHDTLDKAALGCFVAGGVAALAATGLGVWWATGPKDAATKVRVAPLVGRGEGGVVIVGAW
jgi:PEGA domain